MAPSSSSGALALAAAQTKGDISSALPAEAQDELNSRVDWRLLKIGFDMYGKRQGDFRHQLRKYVTMKSDDSSISRPATVRLLLQYMLNNGGSPISFHYRWMSEVRLDFAAGGCSEHSAWCQFFEYLCLYDFLDPCTLACSELGACRVQMIHERWKHKMPSLSAGHNASHDDDSFLLLGTHQTRNNVGVSPALTKWIVDELAKESLAAKGRRKAREERGLAAPEAACKK